MANIPSIEKKVNEVNYLINLANENSLYVIDKSGTWQSPMKYKPLKYVNGTLYIEYEELDLYKHNKTKGEESNWITKKDKVLKKDMEFDNPLNDISKMYKSVLKENNIPYEMAKEKKKNTTGFDIGKIKKSKIKNCDQLIKGELYDVEVKDGKTYKNSKFHFCKNEDENGPYNAIFEDENKGEFFVDTDFIGISYFINPVKKEKNTKKEFSYEDLVGKYIAASYNWTKESGISHDKLKDEDSRILTAIYDAWMTGNIEKAYFQATKVGDTYIREAIPSFVWEKIGGEISNKEKRISNYEDVNGKIVIKYYKILSANYDSELEILDLHTECGCGALHTFSIEKKNIDKFLEGKTVDGITLFDKNPKEKYSGYSETAEKYQKEHHEKEKVSDEDYFKSVNHFVYFCLNYPSNFLDSFNGHIKKHLEEKFQSAYDKYTSYGAMIKFWTELDRENQMKLSKWVKENYKGQNL